MKRWIFILAAFWLCLGPLTAEGGELEDLKSKAREMQKQISIMQKEVRTLQQKSESSADKLTTLKQDLNETRYILGEGVSIGERVRVGGWADFVFETNNSPNFDKNADPEDDNFDETTFAYRTFAVNLAADLADRFRFFGELEFSGAGAKDEIHGMFSHYEDNTFSAERVYVDYNRSQGFNLRMGKFWTPYGIWNQEHVAPLTLSVRNPLLFHKEFIPESTTGAALYGKFFMDDRWYWGYGLWVGNGKGDDPDFQDTNTDKMAGGHLYAGVPWIEGLRLGATFARQKADENGYKAREKVYGLDLLYEKGPFELKAELLRHYRNRFRDSAPVANNPPGFDSVHQAWYVQPAYSLNERWTTFTRFDHEDIDGFKANDEMPNQDLSIWTFGLNYRPVPAVRFKFEYHLHRYDGPVNALGVNKDFEMLTSSVSVLF